MRAFFLAAGNDISYWHLFCETQKSRRNYKSMTKRLQELYSQDAAMIIYKLVLLLPDVSTSTVPALGTIETNSKLHVKVRLIDPICVTSDPILNRTWKQHMKQVYGICSLVDRYQHYKRPSSATVFRVEE
jgi:hypothetical protein